MSPLGSIEDRLFAFKLDLSSLSPEETVRKFLTTGTPYILDDTAFFNLKKEIASYFSIEVHNIYMVGSGRLGFSIKPDQAFRAFSEDTSDIDIAIINRGFFERMWQSVFLYHRNGGWWPEEADFKNYFFKGWIRPDKLPPETSFQKALEWRDFFRNVTSRGTYGRYKIAAGLYYNNFFLESYQSICVTQCKERMERRRR